MVCICFLWDGCEIKSLVSNAQPLPDPYTVSNHTARFTNVTILKTPGSAGGVSIDPRDNSSILFTVDSAVGGIFRAKKVATGNWSIEPVPVVSSLDRPSGMTVCADGTLWWTHDFSQSLKRIRAPWESNAVEEVILNFGPETTDDDPIDVTIAPPNFTGSLGQPGQIVVADRGTDGNSFNAVYLVDPATTNVNQTGYTNFLVTPTTTGLGGANLNAITALPQYGEVVTLGTDGTITAINGSGVQRTILPATLWSDIFSGGPLPSAQAIGYDSTTGRLWIFDDVRDEIWSIDPNPATQGAAPDQKEVSFPLADGDRPDLQIDVHDPGLAFAPNGAFMVVSDTARKTAEAASSYSTMRRSPCPRST